MEQIHIRAESCKEPAAWSADQRYRGPEQFDDEEALAADAEGGQWRVSVGSVSVGIWRVVGDMWRMYICKERVGQFSVSLQPQ